MKEHSEPYGIRKPLLGILFGPTAIAMIVLLKSINLFRNAPQVKAMTQSIRPIVAVLLGVLAYQFFASAVSGIGWVHTLILGIVSLKEKGHDIRWALDAYAFGRGQVIVRNDDGVLCGGTDPRTDGAAVGW